jgi:hypothetical protein
MPESKIRQIAYSDISYLPLEPDFVLVHLEDGSRFLRHSTTQRDAFKILKEYGVDKSNTLIEGISDIHDGWRVTLNKNQGRYMGDRIYEGFRYWKL